MLAFLNSGRWKILAVIIFPVKGKQCNFFTNNIPAVILTYILFSLSTLAYAQQKITGIVSSEDHVPLSGATIKLKGTNNATLTIEDGSFSIKAKAGDVLEISHIGFATKQLTIGNERDLRVTLSSSVLALDEIILTGYTAQRIKEITGSVAVVKPKELTAVPAGQVEQMLQGRVAGLTVITSGMPGSPSNVRLHGIGNFGDVTPLYIIDGVEGNINSLNPNDIESIQVLKDAGAYSIYGVRGANGVLVITTKKGKSGRTRISYDGYVGTTRPLKKGLDLLTPQENADLIWRAKIYAHDTAANGYPFDPLYGNGPVPVLPDYFLDIPYEAVSSADTNRYNIDPAAGDIYQIARFNKSGTDWFHEGFKPAVTQNHTITLSGGAENNHYLFSFGYLDQQATWINTYLKRYTTRVNTEFELLKNIRVGENLQLGYSRNPRVAFLSGILLTNPFIPVYDIKGNGTRDNVVFPPGPANNAITYWQRAKDDRDNNWQVFGNAFAEIDFLKKFTFRSSFGGALNYYYNYNFNYGSYDPSRGSSSFSERSGYTRSWTSTHTLTYAGTIGTNHSIKALVGVEEKSNYNREQGGSRSGYFTSDPDYRFLSTGDPSSQANYSIAGTSFLSSVFSQVSYNYKEKYFVSGTLRNDGSSVFGPENRFGSFPAVGVAWRITEEDFMKHHDWVRELKLRASWGKTGYYGNTDPFNQFTLYGGGPASSYYAITGSNNSIQQGFRTVRFGNAKTGWQEDVVSNIGFESILWGGKLNVTADWYDKKSKGLLFPVSLPALLGDVTPPNINVGNVKNTGIDLLLGSKGEFSKNWKWDLLLTFSHYKNKIIQLNDLPFFDAADSYNGIVVRNEVGFPISSFYGYKVIGLFQDSADVAKSPLQEAAAPGRFKYADVNGRDSIGKLTGKPDGKITDADRVHFGNPSPKFTLGFNIGINFKNFDFSTFFYGSFGNDVLNDFRNYTDVFAYFPEIPKSKTALYNSWTPEHRDAKAPVAEYDLNFSNAAVPNSYRLENGSYLRNKTMTLGYTFSKNRLQKFKIERFRIYVQAVNLFTVTGYSGLDPELSDTSSAFGLDFSGNYPNNEKQWIVGFGLGF